MKKNYLLDQTLKNTIFYGGMIGLWALTTMCCIVSEDMRAMFYVGLIIILGLFARHMIEARDVEEMLRNAKNPMYEFLYRAPPTENEKE